MEKFKLNKTQAIGLFVIIILAAIFIVVNFLRGEDIFKKSNRYYTTLQSVEGLTASSPVYIRGLKIGIIEDIHYDPVHDYFVARLSVKNYYEIAKNSVVEIYSSDIMGGKAMRIELGDSTLSASPGDTLRSIVVPDIISFISKEIAPMGEQLSDLMSNMNATLANINDILDSTAKENIAGSLANLNKSLKNIERLSASLNDVTPDIASIMENLDTLSANLSRESGNFAAIVANINKISSDLANADIQAAVVSIKSLTEKLQDPNGSVGKLLSTPELHDSVDSLVNNLNNFVEKMTENPKKFIKISVF